MPIQGDLREGSEHLQFMQLPRQASAQTWRSSFPRSRQEPLKPSAQRAALPWALAQSGPCSGTASTFEQNRTKGNRSAYPFDEEALLQDSSCFLHCGQQGRELSPHQEAPEPWQPVPLHVICLRKLIFLCYPPPPTWRTLPSLFFSPSLPTYETFVKQWAGSDTLPALWEVKRREV